MVENSRWRPFLKTDEYGFSKSGCVRLGKLTLSGLKVGLFIPTLFLALSMTPHVFGQPGSTLPKPVQSTRRTALSDSLNAYLRRLPVATQVSLDVQSLADSSIAFRYRADERVPSASVIKLAILLEAMEQAKAGTLDLDEIHILTDSEKTGGDGVLKTYSHRSRIAYRDLLRLMMVYSDNTATNIFINELGRDTINQRMRTIGLMRSQLNRVMMDTVATRQDRDNYVTAREMSVLLKKIYEHQVATPDLCDQMLDILKQTEDTVAIPGRLPKGTVVAHKTGTLSYVRADVGIVYTKNPFLLSVFVEGVPTLEAERIIGELAFISYNYFK